MPRLYVFRASSEDVVACASGTSNFCTVASDSPNSVRNLDVASPSESSTFSLDAAVACSCASISPFWQFTAFNSSTYSLPRLAIDPAMYALLPARWQISRATSGLIFVSAERAISRSVVRTLVSDRVFRKGDWAKAMPKCGFQRVIKNCIAGSVIEVAQDDRVFLGELDLLLRSPVQAEGDRDHHCGRSSQNPPPQVAPSVPLKCHLGQRAARQHNLLFFILSCPYLLSSVFHLQPHCPHCLREPIAPARHGDDIAFLLDRVTESLA